VAARGAFAAADAGDRFLHLTSNDETRAYLLDFHQGLAEAGYVEGKNVAIEYRWGEGRNDRMPNLIADLVRRQVSVIVRSRAR
jgi:putative tryptophan/tyrosine transport system substrate-binding protein